MAVQDVAAAAGKTDARAGMEPDHRPILADSTVIQAVNNGEVRPDGFLSAGPAVNLSLMPAALPKA
jgi:hypothetical protein